MAVIFQSKEYPQYLGKSGSCTLFSRNRKYFVTCTRHQLDIKFGNEDELNKGKSPLFSFANNDGQIENIPFGQCFFSTVPDEGEEHGDILIFAIDVDLVREKRIDHLFFPLNLDRAANTVQSLIVGQPTSLGNLSYDLQEIEFTNLIIIGQRDSNFATNVSFLKRFSYSKEDIVCPDGLSGGAIFSLAESGESYIEGVITRAGNGNVYCVSGGFLAGIVDRI